jgi:hypothetical protein
MEDSPIREIGGSKFSLKLGAYFGKLSKKFLERGSKKILSNPTSKFVNPFTLILTFTMNNVDKYQVTLVNDYKEKFKAFKAREAAAIEAQLKAEIIKYRETKKNLDEDVADISDDELSELIPPIEVTIDAIENKEMFLVILGNKDKWFLKK